jgi:hypothetical protein
MIDALTTEAMWDILHDFARRQKGGEKVTAEDVHGEIIDFLAYQEIEFPATFEGNSIYEIFRIFVDGGAVFVDNSYPEMGPQRFVHPIFIECSTEIDSTILSAYPQLGEYLTRSFCPDVEPAADAAGVEAEPDPDAGLFQHVEMATTDGTGTASGWIPKRSAKIGSLLDIGDERDWRVTVVYDGFILNREQMKLLPPTGYISDTRH